MKEEKCLICKKKAFHELKTEEGYGWLCHKHYEEYCASFSNTTKGVIKNDTETDIR